MRPAVPVALVILAASLCFAQQPAPPAANPAAPAAQAPHPTPSPDKPAEAVFENIKVLKGVPSDQLVPSMQFFTGALGVGCDHCHFPDKGHEGFVNDDKKPKQIARQMITMVQQINANNFKGEQEVTCATCHNGKARPARTAPIATVETIKARLHPQAPVDRASLPPASQLFEAFTNAIGGQAAVDKLKSSRATGQMDFGRGQPVPFEAIQEAPNKNYMRIDISPNRTHLEAFDGSTGWSKDGQRLTEAHGNELAVMKLDSNFYLDMDPKQAFPNAQTRGKEKVGDQDAWVVRAAGGHDQPQELLYFDPETKLLLRRVVLLPTPMGPLNTQLDYSDWREVNGVKVAHAITQSRPNSIITQRITKLDFNVPVDAKIFEKPALEATPAASSQPGGETRK